MSEFKIIGIKALTGCDTKYSKILALNNTYLFHSDYTINEETDELSYFGDPMILH